MQSQNKDRKKERKKERMKEKHFSQFNQAFMCNKMIIQASIYRENCGISNVRKITPIPEKLPIIQMILEWYFFILCLFLCFLISIVRYITLEQFQFCVKTVFLSA